MIRRLLIALAFVAAAAATAGAEGRLHALRSSQPAGSQLLYLPSGKYLRAMAPGFREVMADVLYLWSIQYYADYRPDERSRFLEHVYAGVITELDPHYQDPYIVGALIMAVEAGDVEMGLRLLDKGIAANPNAWLLMFEAGFYCYDTLQDYARAARYFERAMMVPGVHPLVRRLHAEMYNLMGDRRASWRYWLEIYNTAEGDYVRSVAYRHVHDLKIQVDLESLTSAVKAYAGRFGRFPADLGALVEARILSSVPHDPEGNPYVYNRNNGQVRSAAKPLLRQRQL